MRNPFLRAAGVLALAVVLGCLLSMPVEAATCTWQPASGAWGTAANWSCGAVPGAGDIAVVNGSTTPTAAITGVTTSTISALQVINNATATLTATAAATLTMNNAGTGLQVDAGSTLVLGASFAITLTLPSGTTGTVSGAMSFAGAAHRLNAVSASPMTFQNGSSFTADTGFTGNAFGTTSLNSIVFASGSRYVFKAGSNPFGATQPNSVVVFQTGSLYLHQASGAPSMSGRTYANFEYNVPATTVSVTGGNPLSIDNLTVTAGTFNLGMTGTFNLKGNVSVVGTLGFNAASAATITLNGSTAQTIGGAGTLTVGANETIALNNVNGLTLLRDVTLGGPLTLTSGDVTTGAFTLTLGGAVGGVGDIVGNAKRLGPFTPATNYTFNNANTLINFNSITVAPGDITILLAKPATPAGLTNAIPRQYTITPTAVGTFDTTLRLGYLQSEVTANPAIVELALGAFKLITGVWTFQPGSVDTVNNFVTATNVGSFSDWAIAPTGASTPPSGVGAATPGVVAPTGTTLLTVNVTPGSNPVSTGITVTADLTAIGGSATQTLFDDGTNGDVTGGDNIFSFSATVGAVGSGTKSLPFTISDAQARTGGGTISLSVPTRIHDIQGNGASSPLAGSVVAIDGIVIGSFQGTNGLGGFFVEEPFANWDADPNTSEGIFVFSTATPVSVGDRVTVAGTVTEFNGLTELGSVTSISVLSNSNPLPPAVEPPVPAVVSPANDWERFEGMLVTFNQPLYMTDTFNMAKFGEIGLSSGAVRPQPTNTIDPNDSPASGTTYSGNSNVAAVTTQQTANNNNLIYIDDGRNGTNLSPETYLPVAGGMRLGSTVTNITGPLTYQFNLYMVEPNAMPTFTPAARPPSPSSVGSPTVKVAFQNTLNFFVNTQDVPGSTGRGAANATEFGRQRAKLVAAMSSFGADVIGLSELEKDPTSLNGTFADNEAAKNLAAGVSTATGHLWAATADPWSCETDGAAFPCNIGTDPDIKCGIIYDTTTVTPVGTTFTDSAVGAYTPAAAGTYSRGPYAQVFQIIATGGKFAVVVNHLRSKGCSGSSGLDADQGDGQGCFNARRTSQSLATSNFVANHPGFAGVANVLVVGDMNAYGEEDPIDAFRANGFVDTLPSGTTSYNFSGQSGHIDHALASSSLSPFITGATVWHINADEPIVTDYVMTGKPADAPYAADAYRCSDHDPVIVGIMGTVPVTLTTFTAE